MLKSEGRPVKTAISQLFWYSFQTAVVAFWLWVEWSRSQETGEPARPLLAFGLGVGFAFVLSIMWLAASDLLVALRLRLAVKLAHVSEPRNEGDSLTATRGKRSKPLELFASARVCKKPR